MQPFQISTDFDVVDKLYDITPEIRLLIKKLQSEVTTNGNAFTLIELNKLIAAYPHIPQFKNLLSILYSKLGNNAEAFNINDRILDEFPDYLYAKINKARQLILEGDFEQALDILKYSIDELYPKRKIFHVTEVASHNDVVIDCLVHSGSFEEAEELLEVYKQVASKFEYLEKKKFILEAKLRAFEESIKHLTSAPKMDDIGKNMPPQTDIAPIFNHQIINVLYHYGFEIQQDILEQILALPRKPLIEDLHKVLQDALVRLDYFHEQDESFETKAFPLHALLILGELEDEESLDKVFDFLSYKYEKCVYYWLGDLLFEEMWQPLYQMGKNQLPKFKEQMLRPDISEYVKSTYATALKEIALHQPEKRKEVVEIFREILTHHINNENQSEADFSFCSMLVADCAEGNFQELLPEIKAAYKAGLIDDTFIGEFKVIEKEIKNSSYLKKQEIQPLEKLYPVLLEEWQVEDEQTFDDDEFDEEDSDEDFIDNNYTYEPPHINPEPKIGRNDPCICGSGKKYKKCCME
ncbi:MAG: DUF1186 domain-containing protein [Bacteroidia bacterium]